LIKQQRRVDMDSKGQKIARRQFMLLSSAAMASPWLLNTAASAAMVNPADTKKAFKIIPERCINCVGCVVFCPQKAIRYGGNQAYRIDPEKCVMCGTCRQYCNHDAIVDPSKPEPEVKLHALRTMDCDLCVIGGGPGTTAAVRAAQAGKKVVILEKGPQLGGCGWHAMGLFTRGSKAHLATGAKDNREEVVKELTEKYQGRVDPDMLRKAIFSNGPFFDWLTEFKEAQGRFKFATGMGAMALEGPVAAADAVPGGRVGAGRIVIQTLRAACKNLGVTVLTHHRAVEIVTSKGAVSYVMAEDPGGQTRVNCKACLISTGGFQSNIDMIREYSPLFGDMRLGHNAHGLPENTGDGMALAKMAGAYIDRDAARFDYLIQIPSPMSAFLDAHCKTDEMKVSLLGKRFVNEAGPGGMISEAVIQSQPQGVTYSISDQPLWDERNKAELERDKGKVDPYQFTADMMDEIDDFLQAPDQPLIRANTLEELANQMGFADPRIFVATVKRYNQFCAKGEDTDFGKPAKNLHAINTPPFYAVRNMVHPHGGCCGVAVNAKMEVKAANGGVVPGLYASGDVVTPSLGTHFMVLHDLTWALTGAYMASDSILEYLKTKA
jgi:fumarate reductase flavoprotein subunit